MTPPVDASAAPCDWAARLYVQSAWTALKTTNQHALKTKYHELLRRKGTGRAIVSVARLMLKLMWVICRRNAYCNETTAEDLRFKLSRLGPKTHLLGIGSLI